MVFVVVTLMHEGSCFAVTLVTVFQRKDYGWVVIFGTCVFVMRGCVCVCMYHEGVCVFVCDEGVCVFVMRVCVFVCDEGVCLCVSL